MLGAARGSVAVAFGGRSKCKSSLDTAPAGRDHWFTKIREFPLPASLPALAQLVSEHRQRKNSFWKAHELPLMVGTAFGGCVARPANPKCLLGIKGPLHDAAGASSAFRLS